MNIDTNTTYQRIVHHHEATKGSCKSKLDWWDREISNGNRCGECWLRRHECFCSSIHNMRVALPSINPNIHTKVCIYYHFKEIGRSANTAHLYEALEKSTLNAINNDTNNNITENKNDICEVIIFGDIDAELKLLSDIKQEYDQQRLQTCVLYPSKDSKLLSQWITERDCITSTTTTSLRITTSNDSSNNNSDEINKIRTDNYVNPLPIRIVVLDGTYPQAAIQYKYLANSLRVLYNISLPVVKLDLDMSKPTRSALLGIQSQPGEHKLCSFQAMVLALQQAGQSPEYCDYLSHCLEEWLKYILKSRIKYGKLKQRVKLDIEPADWVKEYRDRNLPKLVKSKLHVHHSTEISSIHQPRIKDNNNITFINNNLDINDMNSVYPSSSSSSSSSSIQDSTFHSGIALKHLPVKSTINCNHYDTNNKMTTNTTDLKKSFSNIYFITSLHPNIQLHSTKKYCIYNNIH